MNSQDLSEYKWENRLVIVLSETTESEKLQQQVDIFKKELKAFKDRKLILIHVSPNKQQILLPEKSSWEKSNNYQELKGSDAKFELILIGLDGGVKLRQQEILQTKKLFSLIDGMPMRQAEMRKND